MSQRKPRVYATSIMNPRALPMLTGRCEVVSNPADHLITVEDVRRDARDFGAIITEGLVPIPTDILTLCPNLKIVAAQSAGYDNLPIDALLKAGIAVTHAPDALTEATADLTFAILLAVVRRVVEGDRFVRAGRWTKKDIMQLWGHELAGKRLGVLGMGRIGRAVARRAIGFGMEIVYHQRHPLTAQMENELKVRFLPFREFLAASDILTIHCPRTPQTENLLDRDGLRALPKGAYLVNVARGGIVNEAALLEALRDGHLAGAAMDVFEVEPLSRSHLMELENVVLTPHIGSATDETRYRMAVTAIQNVFAVLDGKPPLNPIPEWSARRSSK